MDIHTTSPLKLFEYLAARRPIVATDIPTVAKLLRHEQTGLLAPAGDLEAFCRAIERAVDDPALARALGDRAGAEARRYAWTERCRAVLDRVAAP